VDMHILILVYSKAKAGSMAFRYHWEGRTPTNNGPPRRVTRLRHAETSAQCPLADVGSYLLMITCRNLIYTARFNRELPPSIQTAVAGTIL